MRNYGYQSGSCHAVGAVRIPDRPRRIWGPRRSPAAETEASGLCDDAGRGLAPAALRRDPRPDECPREAPCRWGQGILRLPTGGPVCPPYPPFQGGRVGGHTGPPLQKTRQLPDTGNSSFLIPAGAVFGP